MPNLSVFEFSQSPVQFVDHPQGTYSFGIVADDLAAIVDAPSGADLARSVDDQWKGSQSIQTPGGAQKKVVIWEPGVYQYLSSSRKPAAKLLKAKIFDRIKDARIIIDALKDFEVPEDIGDVYVYAIKESETGRIKLGISRDPHARLKQMQTGNSQVLEMVAYRKASNRFKDESAIHSKNAQHHIRGEWFAESATL